MTDILAFLQPLPEIYKLFRRQNKWNQNSIPNLTFKNFDLVILTGKKY